MNASTCAECGTEIASGLLSCPACRRLVHADELKAIADEAERASDPAAAMAAWRRALDLLPPDSRQREGVAKKIEALGRTSNPPEKKSAWGKGAAGAGTLALLFWKFKFALVFVLTKGKLLLLGLTKMSTLLSMILSFGVYWTMWGWPFALGLVVSMYVHEMGHVAMLRRYGIPATAPMFIPGLGAFVRMKQYPANPREDARVGLAGPMWGLGAAIVAYVVFVATAAPIWGAIARFGAWLNLFNMIPIWQLDGGRGFRSLTRRHRWLAAMAVGAAWFLTMESLLLLILVGSIFRALGSDAPAEKDRVGLCQFVLLVAALSALCLIPVAVAPGS